MGCKSFVICAGDAWKIHCIQGNIRRFYIILAGVEGRNLYKAKLTLYTVYSIFALYEYSNEKSSSSTPTDLYNLIEIYTYHNTYTITKFCSVILFFKFNNSIHFFHLILCLYIFLACRETTHCGVTLFNPSSSMV